MKQLLIVFCMLAFSASAQQTTIKDAFLEKWENSKNYMIAVAEAMPETQYNFKPTERQMSFKEQLLHIKSNMDWLSTAYFKTSKVKRENSVLPETKAEIITILSAAFDATKQIIAQSSLEELKETVSFIAGEKSKLQILNLLQDHVTHHRGQLIVYLNINDITPPEYVGW